MKLSTGLENFKGEVSDDLSFAAVEIDKNYWLALPRWRNLCHRLSCDQPQPGSFFQRPRETEKRDPGNEVDDFPGNKQLVNHFIMNAPGVVVVCKRSGIRIIFQC